MLFSIFPLPPPVTGGLAGVLQAGARQVAAEVGTSDNTSASVMRLCGWLLVPSNAALVSASWGFV